MIALQSNDVFGQVDFFGDDVSGAAYNLNVNSTAWGAGLDHYTIDNHLNVINRIQDGTAADGGHSGLVDKVNR